jgi:hypothetical protein
MSAEFREMQYHDLKLDLLSGLYFLLGLIFQFGLLHLAQVVGKLLKSLSLGNHSCPHISHLNPGICMIAIIKIYL